MAKVFNENESIDIVITWVDGNDIEWQKEKKKYKPIIENEESDNAARFRDWDNLNLVIRSIEQNMPWINKIFIVTNGQIPKWYKENDKVKLVFHKDFIPKEYLPTFSSHTIELNLHRIKELSEKFIYFNDDTFVLNPTKKTDFFKNGVPQDSAILHIHCVKKSLMIYQISNNDVALINNHFEMKKVIKKSPFSWFNLKYGIKNNLQSVFLLCCPRFSGFKQHHLPQGYLKTTFNEVWKKEYKELDRVCKCKFRQEDGVNQWLMREWQLCSNNFVPVKLKNRGILIDFEKHEEKRDLEVCKKIIKNSKYKLICINDGDTIKDFQKIKEIVNAELEKKFPKKSISEK